jgi:hypothetical protein
MLDAAIKRGPGRPLGWRKPAPPTTTQKMVDTLLIWKVNLDRPDTVREVLRVAGFAAVEIAALADIAVAAARKRHPGRR